MSFDELSAHDGGYDILYFIKMITSQFN